MYRAVADDVAAEVGRNIWHHSIAKHRLARAACEDHLQTEERERWHARRLREVAQVRGGQAERARVPLDTLAIALLDRGPPALGRSRARVGDRCIRCRRRRLARCDRRLVL